MNPNELIIKDIFEKIIDDVDKDSFLKYFNTFLDILNKKNYIYTIRECTYKNPSGKNGVYRIEKDVHKRMLEKDGIYIFILKFSGGRKSFRLLKASSLTYNRDISWTRIFS